ncbi:Asp23/Gls24 family envelope stress response protein [Nocardiopsis lambiniae]|uniref:Asp23/Gls24 family envelope stress response protein n=1 Tax=Nocardiopsis lambiniae TaxID=3075539 RepID=A0ABU2MB21_9ACTN|nr:hypothetical protein [Nocardiopsis sp. DSM 44743]MDT0329799.1 hypothetical protein [Nocardiopsis sp. DSM 44743]
MALEPPDDNDDLLPCGNGEDALARHLMAGRTTDHEAGCSHCRSAARDLEPLISVLREPPDEETTAPVGLVDDVMRIVRSERRNTRTLTLGGAGPGTTEIRESAVATLVRLSARDVPDVLVGRCRVRRTPDGLVVSLTVLVVGGTPIVEAAERLRRTVRALLEERLRLAVPRIDIDVTGLVEPG